MGLDMYAFTSNQPLKAVNFDMPKDSEELFTWRKHPNLHGWMEDLYRQRGGTEQMFNCVNVALSAYDLDALEAAVTSEDLPDTCGFFFGTSQPEDKALDLDFIGKARQAIAEGKSVFYTSWW